MLIRATYNKKLTEKYVKRIMDYLSKRNPELFIDGIIDNWNQKVINPDFIMKSGKTFEREAEMYYLQNHKLINGSFYKVYKEGNTLSVGPIMSDDLWELLSFLGLVKTEKVPNLKDSLFHYVI